MNTQTCVRPAEDRWPRFALLFGAGALALGLVVSLQSHVTSRAVGREYPLVRTLLLTMPFWFAWSAVGPGVARAIRAIDRRFSHRPALRAVLHCAFAVATIYVVAAIVYGSQRAFSLTDLRVPVWQGALAVAFWRLPMTVLMYAVLISLVYAGAGVATADPPAPLTAPLELPAAPPEATADRPPPEIPARSDAQPFVSRIVVKGGGRVTLVPVDEIDWIEAADYCARLHARGRTYMLRESMTSLESRLDPTRFIRVHRSAIVNLDCVREIQKSFQREHIVILRDGTRVVLSAARRAKLEELLRDTV